MKLTSHVKPDNISKKTIRLDYIEQFSSLLKDGDIYQFGVYSGISILNILEKYQKFNIKTNVWGFDSFCGLPEEKNEKLFYDVWKIGEFSSCDYLDVKTPIEAANSIKSLIKERFPEYPIEMIIGFFSESLKTCPVDRMKPASWVDIDVDIYTSTIEAMTFMMDNNLIIPGTLLYYDDYKGTEFGEGRAHKEICNKYGLKVELLIGTGELLFKVL
jgi:hypothetical protein